MKKHAIIPIFIPHKGCPNDCVFCNQKKITAMQRPFEAEEIERRVEEYLPTLQGRGLEVIEIAFFGGSFTGIPIEEQKAYLHIAKKYKDKGKIHKIHLSTRPDYINAEILEVLREFSVDVIELGVQSFDSEVLIQSNRGHTKEAVYDSCQMIQEYGFELGIQLMIGLPGDTYEKCMHSVQETVKIKPSLARLYPTVILKDTELFELYEKGVYKPYTEEEMLHTVKEMYRTLQENNITILRVGLKSSDIISENGGAVLGSYHPAFRQLVEGELAKEELERQLEACMKEQCDKKDCAAVKKDHKTVKQAVTLRCEGTSFSNMIGNCSRNKKYFEEKYPQFSFHFKTDSSLQAGTYRLNFF